MTLRRANVVAIVIGVVVLFGLFSPTAPYPTYEVYSGPLQFSGERAYQELELFVNHYPLRFAGSKASLDSAEYVAERMREAGLTVKEQDFETYTAFAPDFQNEKRGSPFNPGSNIRTIFQPLTGRNVIGFLPGKKNETVVIGAHRDIISTNEGAEDNGSGTVAMLQLMDILSGVEREYSYVFVSYDAEEIAIMGSERFINEYNDLDITLAVSLDMLGWNEADRVGFYPFAAAGHKTDLWVYSLAMQMAGVRVFYSPNIWQDLLATSRQMIPTDTHPFARRGIAVLGIVAVHSDYPGYSDNRPIHTPGDTMGIVSASTLHMTGQFVEQFLLTLESHAVDRGFTSLYVPRANGVIPPWYVVLAYGLLTLSLLAVVLYDGYIHYVPLTGPTLRRELPWLLGVTALSLGTTFFWYNLFSPPFNSWHLGLIIAIGFGLPGIGLLVLSYLRAHKQEERSGTRVIYSLGLGLFMLCGLPLLGFPKTIILVTMPILLGTFWPVLWLGCFFPIFFALLSPHILSFFTAQTAVFLAWSLLLWVFSGVYGLSKPRASKTTKRGNPVETKA